MRHFRLLLLFSFLVSGHWLWAQDFSNKGKEFWIPYSYHVGAGGASLVMTLYITSDVATSYQVAVHGGVTLQSGNLTAGQVVTCVVPNTYFVPDEGLYSGRAIVVTADKGVVVYSYITQSAVSGATVCLPTSVLGREYISMNYTQVSNQANSNSYFTIIAAEDNTAVEITPTADTKNGWVAGNTYTINLNKGQIYQVLGAHPNTPTNSPCGGTFQPACLYAGNDLTGSRIKSVASGQNACKRIAVFSGAGKIRIGTNCGNNNSSDNLYQQLYPQATWGKSYLTAPSFSRPNNFYRVIRSNATTNVSVNGVAIPSASFVNGYYEFSNNTPNYITADQPISVAQYFTTQGCSSNSSPYDPDMIILNPIEQNISKVTLVSSNLVATGNRQHHIHVIMPSGGTGISSFRFDGAVIPSSATWVPHPALAGYSYLYLSNVSQGYHTLSSDSGFNALAYGYANAESYGYSAGANVKDLYQFISIQNQFATVNFPATCRNTPFNFSMTFPYQPTQIQWVFGTALNGQGIADVTLLNPTPTGTVVVNGRTLYVYKLSNPYTINTVGAYPIKVIATNPSPDGCTGLQEINFDLDVQPKPVADFTFSNVCEGTSVQFTDASNTNTRPINSYFWDFGDNTTGSTLNPTHLYPAPGTYNPRYSIITDIGCITDTVTKTLTVYPKPIASIAGTLNVCQGAPEPTITFTGANGTPPYTFTYTLNGGPPQQIITTSGSSVSINVPTTTVGNFLYALNNVKDGSPLACEQAQTGSATVAVFAKPTGATITGSTQVCLNGTAPTLTLTGQGGSGNYLFTYNLNGGANQTLIATGGTATITVPTGTVGTYAYNLISVEDPSNVLCRTSLNTSATVTVNPLPTASIAGTISVCQNGASPDITFTGAGGTAPYTFVYTLNGGSSQQVISGANGIATVSVPTGTPGTFTYALQSITDATASLCTQLQSGNATVTVNPLPTASIAGTTAVCQNATAPTVTFTGAVGTAPYTFAYNINGGATQTVTTTTGNSVTVSVPTTTPGTFTYNLISVKDASSTTCLQNQTGSALVTVNPLPTASIAGTTSVCLNATSPLITFTGAVGTAPYTFAYNINGGTIQTVTTTTGNSVTVSVPTATAGTFTYNLISVTDASATVCSQNQSGAATVVVYPLPTATFSSLTPRCETGIISFTDQSIPNAGSVGGWSWNFGDPASGANNTSTQQNPQHVFATAGTYNVTLTVTTNNGCVSVNPAIPVVIHAKPFAGFINPEVCLNDTYAQFTDTSSVATPSTVTNWNWNFGDPTSGINNTSTLQNPQHSYLAVGSYPVVLIVTSNQGCKDTVNQTLFVNGSFPVSNFSINNTNNLCANDSISITNLATVLPGVITKVEIFWDDVAQPTVVEIDQNPAPGKVYKHKYPNFQSPLTKTYNIRYRAYSGGVCSNDKVLPITINAAPKVQFNPIPNICLDAPPYQITQASEIGGVPGTLLFTGPGVSSSGLFNPATAGTGTHTIRYYFTSTAGGCIDSATQTIKVWIPPVADFTVSSPVCERQAVTFTNNSTSTEGTLTEWRWDFGDGTPVLVSPNGNPVQHTYATFGNFVVKLNVVTSNGCVSSARTFSLEVKPLARPNFSFPAISCLPSANIQFTNLSSIPDGTQSSFAYLWNFGDPGSGPVNTSTLLNPSHIYSALGPYNVNLQVTSGAGCVHDTTIVLNTLHPQPIASFTTDKIDVCIGGAIQFNSTSNGADGTITQWVWDMDNGTTRNQSNFSYTYSSVGTYNVSHYIVNSFNCKSTTATKAISINPYPVADAGPDKLMLEGGQTQLTPVNNNTMPLTIRWRPASFLSDSTVISPIARPTDDIFYTLYLVSDKGCAAQDMVFVKVLKTPSVPNIFSPNGDGVHDTWVIPYLDTYPGCTVEVVNRYGQLVFRSIGYPTPWDGRVNGNPLPVGTYYYVIDPKNGRKRLAGYVDIIR